MRLLFIIGVLTFYATINSEANSVSLKDERRKESQQFVVDLARNFSSFYFQVSAVFSVPERIVSPLSIFIPMSMLAYGARGRTKDTYLKAIGLPKSKTSLAKVGYEIFLDNLAKYDVQMKTKIFVPSDFEVKSGFEKTTKKVFKVEYEKVPVTDGFMDSGKINEWVAAQTHNNVTKLFESQRIGPDPNMVLVNTVYFKGTWQKAFNKSLTELRPFHPLNSERSVDVPTMYTEGRFRYGRMDGFNASFIELPYKSNSENETMSMFIILPDDKKWDDWKWLVYELRNMNLNKLLNSTEKDVKLYLPKFKIEINQSLTRIIDRILNPDLSKIENHVDSAPSVAALRARQAAELERFIGFPSPRQKRGAKADRPKPARFSGFFKHPKPMKLGETATKIVIEVGEEGQETAESSGISYNAFEASSDRKTRSANLELIEFKVDRPFIAIVALKGRILTDIFSINFNGFTFIPEDATFW
ncbi:serine protease inhibitor 3/4-like [Venturia canescens]|uniref:serine protease inhibitor 3/4-like n=1 Tax=Venturia canescens TaxID=32260 RepID=UPI001C9C3B38|nr:serine protease inhibitor 3/4-like [Venturia canescens]